MIQRIFGGCPPILASTCIFRVLASSHLCAAPCFLVFSFCCLAFFLNLHRHYFHYQFLVLFKMCLMIFVVLVFFLRLSLFRVRPRFLIFCRLVVAQLPHVACNLFFFAASSSSSFPDPDAEAPTSSLLRLRVLAYEYSCSASAAGAAAFGSGCVHRCAIADAAPPPFSLNSSSFLLLLASAEDSGVFASRVFKSSCLLGFLFLPLDVACFVFVFKYCIR